MNLDAGASSRKEGPDPAQAVRRLSVAIPVIANVNHLRYNVQENRLMRATMPLAENLDHFRWLDRRHRVKSGPRYARGCGKHFETGALVVGLIGLIGLIGVVGRV